MTLKQQIEDHIDTVFFNTDHFAVAVTISNGRYSVDVDAIVSSSIFESVDGMGVMRTETRDYLVPSDKLIFNSRLSTPSRGMTVIEGSRTYVVTEPAGQPAFAYEDEDQLLLRIHTVLAKS